jgi:hypothetical protein
MNAPPPTTQPTDRPADRLPTGSPVRQSNRLPGRCSVVRHRSRSRSRIYIRTQPHLLNRMGGAARMGRAAARPMPLTAAALSRQQTAPCAALSFRFDRLICAQFRDAPSDAARVIVDTALSVCCC